MKITLGVKTEEDFKKAIPSIVYFNHFKAIRFHLESDDNRFNLRQVPYYGGLTCRNADFLVNQCRQLFWNSWSTEHAFLFPKRLGSHDYFKYSLQWGFPQAYYSVYLSMIAFRETQEKTSDNHEKAIKVFGTSVRDGHYPEAICFYASGLYESFSYHNLSNFAGSFKDFNSVASINGIGDAHTQIANFLKSTRERNAWDKRERLEKANDKEFFSKSGHFLKAFRKKHWDKIYGKIPVTSVMNMLYRLRIKANYRDIEAFLNADIAFEAFHENLAFIVDYLNFLHEAYFVKAVGKTSYEYILNGFRPELIEETALRRYEMIKAL
jgi:hypothetical protein